MLTTHNKTALLRSIIINIELKVHLLICLSVAVLNQQLALRPYFYSIPTNPEIYGKYIKIKELM